MSTFDNPAPLLRVEALRVFGADNAILAGPVSFTVHAGHAVALRGDSGSGKTLILRSLMNLLPEGLRWQADLYEIEGRDARIFTKSEWRMVRGQLLGLVQQDSGDGLDPLKRIQSEVLEAARLHRSLDDQTSPKSQARALLRRAGLTQPEKLLRRWPHQLSGGMRQRALIASALSAQPRLLLADEPTTALDATTQQAVLKTLDELKDEGIAIVLVSHDPAVVARIAEHTVELNSTEDIVLGDADESSPGQGSSREHVPPTREPAALLRVESVTTGYASRGQNSQIRDISFQLATGTILGVVGESGAGKTTLARALTATLALTSGSVTIGELPWSSLSERSRRAQRWRVQWVPQDPLASFARGMTVQAILREALSVVSPDAQTPSTGVNELLKQVGLDAHFALRLPRTLSGGQRQRVAIARALATRPQILICDEAVSALDASARRGILQLLRRLAREQRLAVIFISHHIDVISQVSDELLIMKDGAVVEQGTTAVILEHPAHPFTQKLIADSGYSR